MEYGILKETGLHDKEEKFIEINGKKWSESTLKEALRQYAKN